MNILEQYQMLQEHPKTHFCNKSKCKMFRLLESFNNMQNRLRVKIILTKQLQSRPFSDNKNGSTTRRQ